MHFGSSSRERRAASAKREDALFARVVGIIEAARVHVARSVNTAMVQAYWLIGREIVEVEQHGEKRAGYGERVVEGLARRLATRIGKGFSVPNLRNMRQFLLSYPRGSGLRAELGGPGRRTALHGGSRSSRIRSALSSESGPALFPPLLGWTHYLILMRVVDPTARAFYEIEAARGSWSSLPRRPRVLQPPAALLRARRSQARQAHAPGPRADADVCELLRPLPACEARGEDHRHRAVLREERRDGEDLPEDNERILAARYQLYLPTEAELRAELAREREVAERALRRAGQGGSPSTR